jgi:hypothetical protein
VKRPVVMRVCETALHAMELICVISALKEKHNLIEPAVDCCDILTLLVCWKLY